MTDLVLRTEKRLVFATITVEPEQNKNREKLREHKHDSKRSRDECNYKVHLAFKVFNHHISHANVPFHPIP
jgi:hypothetical protein